MKVVIKCADGTKSAVEAENVEVNGASLSEWAKRLSKLEARFANREIAVDESIANVKRSIRTEAEAIDSMKKAVVKAAGGN